MLDTHTEPEFLTQIILDVKRQQNLQESTSSTILVLRRSILKKLAHIHNSQHTKFFFDYFQSYTAIYFDHSELSREEKSRFEYEEKNFSLSLKVAFSRQKPLQTSLFSNKLNFFHQIQILIFLGKTTQSDHNRLLYKFENDQKHFGCVGSFGYPPASAKKKIEKIFAPENKK